MLQMGYRTADHVRPFQQVHHVWTLPFYAECHLDTTPCDRRVSEVTYIRFRQEIIEKCGRGSFEKVRVPRFRTKA